MAIVSAFEGWNPRLINSAEMAESISTLYPNSGAAASIWTATAIVEVRQCVLIGAVGCLTPGRVCHLGTLDPSSYPKDWKAHLMCRRMDSLKQRDLGRVSQACICRVLGETIKVYDKPLGDATAKLGVPDENSNSKSSMPLLSHKHSTVSRFAI